MTLPARTTLVSAAVLLTLCAGCSPAGKSVPPASPTARTIELPGDRDFPEGIAYDERDGTVYTGSTQTGAIYRATSSQQRAEQFLPGGQDGRTAVTGMVVDEKRDLLVVAGRVAGRVFTYRLSDGSLVGAFAVPGGGRSLVNDIAVVGDAAYITDSFRPLLYRLDLSAGAAARLEPWLDLDGTLVPFGDGFNLNGIAANTDGSVLLTVHSASGRLFRIAVSDGSVTEVDLATDSLPEGDGIELDGTTLYAVSRDKIAVVNLNSNLRRGTLTRTIRDETWRFPTTIALRDDGLLVVNSQLDATGPDRAPALPFTITSIGSN